MAEPREEIETIVRNHFGPLSGSLGADIFEYIALSVVSVFQDGQSGTDVEEELMDFLLPYFEDLGIQKPFCIVSDLVSDVRQGLAEPMDRGGEHDHDILCSIHNLSLMYGGGADRLLCNASLVLRRGHCYGVVGRNGKGKTTLMSKIASGQLEFATELKCCYIQYEGILDGIDPAISCSEYVKLRSGCEDACTYLQRVGFSEEACQKSVDHLSGGWRMRLALASAFLDGADLYLLDEPTNHLDSSGKAWLQEYLLGDGRNKTAMIISHDHTFLDRVCTDLIQFTSEGKLEYHSGDFHSFWQQTKPETTPEKVPPERCSQLQAETFSSVNRPRNTSAIALPNPGRNGFSHVVATLTGCNFRHVGQQALALKDVTLQLGMKCRVGVVGSNGAGKSTLLNLLARELLPVSEGGDEGVVWHHRDLRLAYIAQQHFFHLSEHLEKTPIDYVQNRFGSDWDEELRRRLVLPHKPEAIEHRRCMAEKYGGKPYYFDTASNVWKGREVAVVLARRVEHGELQYLVEWKVQATEAEAGIDAENTWEPARKLRYMGVEMMCLAYDSRDAYTHMPKRSLSIPEVTKHLKSVGIAGSMACQPIGTFSAGEMSRLVLAASLWTKPHILLLDEPTNFLDLETVDALAEAIKVFQGGVVVVSHNVGFLQETCHEVWQAEDGYLTILAKDGTDKGAMVKRKLLAQAAQEKEKHARELEKQLSRMESKPEDVGRVISKDAVFDAFRHFIGFNIPEEALQFAVDYFVSVAEERQPPGSGEWLAVVVAAVQMLASIGFEELDDMNRMAAIFVALLRHLLKTQAVGATDGGESMSISHIHHIHQLRSLQFREKAIFFEQCCYCGQELDPECIDKHEKECLMSPMRCGRQLNGSKFEFEMFHGTSEHNAAAIERDGFRPSIGGMLGPGVYCSRDLRKARRYGPVVLRLCVHLGRVITIDRHGHPLQKIWQTEAGGSFDAAWVPPNSGVVPSGLEENCVRSPSQIVLLGREKLDRKTAF